MAYLFTQDAPLLYFIPLFRSNSLAYPVINVFLNFTSRQYSVHPACSLFPYPLHLLTTVFAPLLLSFDRQLDERVTNFGLNAYLRGNNYINRACA